MKIRLSLLQLFAALGIVLTLSLFFFSHAAVAEAAEDNAALLGRADARADTNKLAWFSFGCGTGVVSMYLLVLWGKDLIEAEKGESVGYMKFVLATVIAGVGGAVIRADNSPLLTDRLIGKSPEYVKVYGAAYEEEKFNIKNQWGTGGFLLGITGVLLAVYSAID